MFVGFGPASKRARKEGALEQCEGEAVPEGFVMFKGSLLDIGKLVNQLKRSEKARLDTETRMMEIQHDLTISSEKCHKQSSSIKDLTDDLKIYKDKLRSSDEKLKKVSVSGILSTLKFALKKSVY